MVKLYIHSPNKLSWRGAQFKNTGTALTFTFVFISVENHDSSDGIALGYGLDDRGCMVRFPAGAGNISLHHRFQNGPTQPPIQ
jgi:hypothetical protein